VVAVKGKMSVTKIGGSAVSIENRSFLHPTRHQTSTFIAEVMNKTIFIDCGQEEPSDTTFGSRWSSLHDPTAVSSLSKIAPRA
jgi:hypothetical protein